MDADVIDQCKENIQPLKHGRKVDSLALALKAQESTELHDAIMKEQEKFETLIHTYDGDDPLQLRYDYVMWLEQNYPKHGPESNLIPLLEDTISNYKENDKYKQDHRFIELILKYIDMGRNFGERLELYQIVYSQGIGTMCSELYKAWAEELGQSRDFKKADQVFLLGISINAQPLESLKKAHELFQLNVGRRLVTGDLELSHKKLEEHSEDIEPRRVVVKRHPPRSLAVPTCNRSTPLGTCNRNVTPHPCRDCKGTENLDPLTVQFRNCVLEPANPEATVKTHVRNKSNSFLSFKVHEDCEVPICAHPLSNTPNALKTLRSEGVKCPMAIFEPHDPSVKVMYCKSKVYAGGSEFQLEEIRAAAYNKCRKPTITEECKMFSQGQPRTFCLTPLLHSSLSDGVSCSI